MKSGKLFLLFTLIAIAVGFYLSYFYLFTAQVVVAEAYSGTAIKAVSGTVTVKPKIESRIMCTGTGWFVESFLEEGKEVKKGEVVGRVEPDDLRYRIRNTQRDLDRYEKIYNYGPPSSHNLKLKERNFAKMKDMYERGFISQAEFEQHQIDMDAFKWQIEMETDSISHTKQARLEALDEMEDLFIRRLTVTSPMDGVITAVHSFKDEYVGNGGTLASLISKEMKISAEVNQDDIELIQIGGKAKVRFFTYGDKLFEAKVTQILPNANYGTQRFTIYITLIEPPQSLKPGMTGEVSLYADERPNTILIPRLALIGNSVFVVKNNQLERRKVTTGYLSFSHAEILSGIQTGDQVVAENVDLYREGDRVNIKNTLWKNKKKVDFIKTDKVNKSD